MKYMTGLKVYITDEKIVINKIFEKKTRNPESKEYRFLREIRADYPNFKIVVREIKKNPNKQTYAGLTYDYMRNYIRTEAPEKDKIALLREFDKLIRVSKCQAKSRRYPVIKKWFLDKFPEIAEFGITAEAIENEEVTAIEEAIEDEEVIETEETMDIAEAPAVSKAA